MIWPWLIIKALSLDTTDVLLYGDVLRSLWIRNKNREAYAYADKVIALFPNDGYAFYVRGNLKRDFLHKYPEGNIDIKRSEMLAGNRGRMIKCFEEGWRYKALVRVLR